MSITLESLKTQYYTKARLQDENVKYGLARCLNEPKAKTVQKLVDYLSSVKTRVSCSIQLDKDTPLEYVFPVGKTKGDLVAYL